MCFATVFAPLSATGIIIKHLVRSQTNVIAYSLSFLFLGGGPMISMNTVSRAVYGVSVCAAILAFWHCEHSLKYLQIVFVIFGQQKCLVIFIRVRIFPLWPPFIELLWYFVRISLILGIWLLPIIVTFWSSATFVFF